MYDVIIVGSGIGGAYLASKLKCNVLILEKDSKVKPKDSGIVSKRFFDFFGKNFVKNEITEMKVISPSRHVIHLHNRNEPMAYILKREEFLSHIRALAKTRAEIRNEIVTGIKYEDGYVTVTTDSGTYETRIIVGADGGNSIVRRSANIPSPNLALGIMIRTKKRLTGPIKVYMNKYYSPDFYSWIIPQNNEYGLISGARAKAYLDHFQSEHQLPGGKLYAALLPVGTCQSYTDHTLLLGEAAGVTKPLTGGGIVFSLITATFAADIINDAVQLSMYKKDFLSAYERGWELELNKEINKQLFVRKLYKKLTNKDIDKIFQKFGPHVENFDYDYDHLSEAAKRIPKLKLLSFALSKARLML